MHEETEDQRGYSACLRPRSKLETAPDWIQSLDSHWKALSVIVLPVIASPEPLSSLCGGRTLVFIEHLLCVGHRAGFYVY